MSISTYSELLTAVASWSARNDLTATIPDFIALAESKFNRRLRTRHQEATLAATATSSYLLTIPTSTVAVRNLWVSASPTQRLEQKTLDYVIEQQINGTTGYPTFYAWSAGNWVFDADGTVQGVYYIKVPALTSGAPTNWLLTGFPDLYLWGCLEQVAHYLKNANDVAKWGGMTDGLIAELNSISRADQISGGPLLARVR